MLPCYFEQNRQSTIQKSGPLQTSPQSIYYLLLIFQYHSSYQTSIPLDNSLLVSIHRFRLLLACRIRIGQYTNLHQPIYIFLCRAYGPRKILLNNIIHFIESAFPDRVSHLPSTRLGKHPHFCIYRYLHLNIVTFKPLIVTKNAQKSISIKQSQFSLHFFIFGPHSFKNCAFTKIVDSFSFLASILEFTHISVLVSVLKIARAILQPINKATGINTAIAINSSPSAMFEIILKLSVIQIVSYFVQKVTVTRSIIVFPLPFVKLLATAKCSETMFLIIFPATIIESLAVVIIIYASSLFVSIDKIPIINLTTDKNIYAFAMKEILLPPTEIDISVLVNERSFAVAYFMIVYLAKVNSIRK